MNGLQFFLEYWSKKIEEYFNLLKPDTINLSVKYTTQAVKNVMNRMVKHLNYTEQGMIVLQEKFIESDNVRVKQSIIIYQLIWEIIPTKKLHQLLYLINNVNARIKQSSETHTGFPWLLNSALQSMEEIPF